MMKRNFRLSLEPHGFVSRELYKRFEGRDYDYSPYWRWVYVEIQTYDNEETLWMRLRRLYRNLYRNLRRQYAGIV